MFLKKLTSISFLFLLLLFHYSRLLDYLECPYNPLTTQSIVACDCVKDAPEKPVGNGEPAQSRIMSRQKTEDVFAGNRLFTLSWQEASPSWKGGRPPGDAILCGFAASIFQPPRS